MNALDLTWDFLKGNRFDRIPATNYKFHPSKFPVTHIGSMDNALGTAEDAKGMIPSIVTGKLRPNLDYKPSHANLPHIFPGSAGKWKKVKSGWYEGNPKVAHLARVAREGITREHTRQGHQRDADEALYETPDANENWSRVLRPDPDTKDDPSVGLPSNVDPSVADQTVLFLQSIGVPAAAVRDYIFLDIDGHHFVHKLGRAQGKPEMDDDGKVTWPTIHPGHRDYRNWKDHVELRDAKHYKDKHMEEIKDATGKKVKEEVERPRYPAFDDNQKVPLHALNEEDYGEHEQNARDAMDAMLHSTWEENVAHENKKLGKDKEMLAHLALMNPLAPEHDTRVSEYDDRWLSTTDSETGEERTEPRQWYAETDAEKKKRKKEPLWTKPKPGEPGVQGERYWPPGRDMSAEEMSSGEISPHYGEDTVIDPRTGEEVPVDDKGKIIRRAHTGHRDIVGTVWYMLKMGLV